MRPSRPPRSASASLYLPILLSTTTLNLNYIVVHKSFKIWKKTVSFKKEKSDVLSFMSLCEALSISKKEICYHIWATFQQNAKPTRHNLLSADGENPVISFVIFGLHNWISNNSKSQVLYNWNKS